MSVLRTQVTPRELVFRLADPDHDLREVRVWHDLDVPGLPSLLEPVTGGWELHWPHPPADRVEYQFTASHPALGEERAFLLDPRNPLTVDGPFGPKSWLALPGYRVPAWLQAPAISCHRLAHTVTDTVAGDIDVVVWSPDDAEFDEPLPMLFAHDGPELDEFAGLTHLVGAFGELGRLPRMRVALLAPGDRNPRYAANPAYARALTEQVVPKVLGWHPTSRPPVLAGASLGGLAALHAEWRHPGTFAGLLLLSGSFFTPELDSQESGFAYWREVVDFVAEVHAAPAAPARPAVALGWGTVEENRHNNTQLARHLRELGLPVIDRQVADTHTFTTWRDLLDPLLPDLLTLVWGEP